MSDYDTILKMGPAKELAPKKAPSKKWRNLYHTSKEVNFEGGFASPGEFYGLDIHVSKDMAETAAAETIDGWVRVSRAKKRKNPLTYLRAVEVSD